MSADVHDPAHDLANRINHLNTAGTEHLDVVRHGSSYGPTTVGDNAKVHLGDTYNFYAQPPKDIVTDPQKRYELLRDSLLFDNMHFRMQHVEKALLSTCEWLLDHPDFQVWHSDTRTDGRNGFLWIRGKPGSGKSTLMKTAYEWTLKQDARSTVKKTIIPYFFNGRAASMLEKSSLGLYRTIVYRLISSYPSLLRPIFMNKFDPNAAGALSTAWTSGMLRDFLYAATEEICTCSVYLFIDALDEAEYKNDIEEMIDFLRHLSDQVQALDRSCQFQVCLSSRYFPNIEIGSGISLYIEKQTEHAMDIRRYISRQLIDFNGHKQEFEMAIFERSDHVFLWVTIIVKMLNELNREGTSIDELRARLSTTPSDLEDLYEQILTRSPDGIETTALLLQWTLFAERLMRPEELYMAMHYSRASNKIDWTPPTQLRLPSAQRIKDYIIHHSRGLVEVTEPTQSQPSVVQFIHETVREFLSSPKGLASILQLPSPKIVGFSHERLRLACFDYISTSSIRESYSASRDKQDKDKNQWKSFKKNIYLHMPFIGYAVNHIFHHSEKARRCGIPFVPGLKAQMEENGIWKKVFRFWWVVVKGDKYKEIGRNMTLLYFLIRNQFMEINRTMIQALGGINMECGLYGSVLQLAIAEGHPDIALLLLDEGANADYKGGFYGSALQAASDVGHSGLVNLLLSKPGVTVNHPAPEGHYGFALLAATACGHLDIVEILLRHGAEINAKGGVFHSAAQNAVASENLGILKFVIHKGAEINAAGGRFGSALQLAAMGGQLEMVEYLLLSGANVNLIAGDHHTALKAAAAEGKVAVVQTLLDNGADPTITGGTYGNALQAAVVSGFKALVEQLLLRKDVDVNATGGRYHTALNAALEKNSDEIAAILIAKGARKN